MNFEWMKEHTELAALYGSALEAEKFVLVHPTMSAMASRKAMEIVVKTLYQEAVNGEDMPVFVDDMTTTWDFRIIVSDNVVINAIHTMREQYVSLDSAVEQMLREMASGNEKKGQLMTNKSWCREYLGMDRPVLLPLSNNVTKEERQKYSKNALHIGNKKFFYLTEWDKASLFSLRARSGKVGEELVTLDRMADWGFADPDSPAALRARERARIREAEEAAKEAKRQSELQADQLARASKSMLDEVSPKEIRNAIQKMPDYQQNVSLLTIPDWCKKHIGMDEPVLLAEGEWMRLRKRQQSAGKLLTYSACMVSIGRVSYVIHRMDHDTYDAMLKAFQSLGI